VDLLQGLRRCAGRQRTDGPRQRRHGREARATADAAAFRAQAATPVTPNVGVERQPKAVRSNDLLGESVAEASAYTHSAWRHLNEGLFRSVAMRAAATLAREAALQPNQLLPRACRPQRPARAALRELTGTALARTGGSEGGSGAGVHGCSLQRRHGRAVLATPVATATRLPWPQPAENLPQRFMTPNVRHERRDAAGEACRGTSARWRC